MAVKKRWFTIRNLAPQTAEICLYGYIGAPKAWNEFGEENAGTAAEFAAELAALGPIAQIQLYVFSYGGDADEGMAMHDILKRNSARKIGTVDGLCASAATFPLMACDEIRMSANASLVIHNATQCICGNAEELRSAATDLDAITQTIAGIYAARSGMPLNKVVALMNAGNRIGGADAVKMKLADTLLEGGEPIPADRDTITNSRDARTLWFDIREKTISPTILNRYDLNAMTEAELKAAEQKLATDRAEVDRLKNEATAEATRIKNEATAEAERIKAAAKPAEIPAAPADLDARITNAVKAATDPLREQITNLDRKVNQGVTAAQLPGAAAVTNVAIPDAAQIAEEERIKNLTGLDKVIASTKARYGNLFPN